MKASKTPHAYIHARNKLGILVSMKRNIFRLAVGVVLFVGACLYFLQPSHERQWQEDLTKLPRIEYSHIDSDVVTIHDMRDWRYDTTGPIEKRWIDRTYNLNNITAVWLIVEPFAKWDGIAHTFFVFDFKDQPPVAVSVEARKEDSEEYSAFLGLFKKYEVIYTWGTEQDFVLRRAVTQQHDLYMYPLAVDSVFTRQLFLDLVNTTKSLYKRPQFYNTLTQNCTNALAHSANRAVPGTVPPAIARILPGYSDEFLYRMNYIADTGTLEEIRAKYFIGDIIPTIDHGANFSSELRAALRARE
jgi:hypothetical protein